MSSLIPKIIILFKNKPFLNKFFPFLLLKRIMDIIIFLILAMLIRHQKLDAFSKTLIFLVIIIFSFFILHNEYNRCKHLKQELELHQINTPILAFAWI